jgi:hypothetical protein
MPAMTNVTKLPRRDAAGTPDDPALCRRIDDDGDAPYRAEDIVAHHQPETAVFANEHGQIVIRQRDEFPWRDLDDQDSWVVIDRAHVETVIAAMRRWAQAVEASGASDEPELDLPARPEPKQDRRSKRERIEAALREHPNFSDRQLAAALGVTHPTIAKMRREVESRAETFHETFHPARAVSSDAPLDGAPLAPDGAPVSTLFTNEKADGSL